MPRQRDEDSHGPLRPESVIVTRAKDWHAPSSGEPEWAVNARELADRRSDEALNATLAPLLFPVDRFGPTGLGGKEAGKVGPEGATA